MTKDVELCKMLNETISHFVAPERLDEVAHGMVTQVNESLNFSISIEAQKNKAFCGTRLLSNRIAIAVGIASLGFMPFYKHLYKSLGIVITPNIVHFLEVKGRNRNKRPLNANNTSTKKRHKKRKMDNLWKEESKAKLEWSKRDGACKQGGHIQVGGFDADDADAPAQKKSRKAAVCPLCGLKGHSTAHSKHCLCHKSKAGLTMAGAMLPALPGAVASKTNTETLDAVDAKQMNVMPLQYELPSYQEEFFESETWSFSSAEVPPNSMHDE